MLRNVSGAHIQRIDDTSRPLYKAKAGCIKVLQDAFDLDLLRAFHDVNPDSPCCCRLVDNSANFDNMRRLTQQAINKYITALAIFGDLLYIEILPNEAYCNGDELKHLSEMTALCAKDIADAGAKPVGFNLPVGNPADLSQTAYMLEGVVALNKYGGAVGYHNYTIPSNQLDQYLDLRHELMAKFLPQETKWWLGEGFYDHGIVDGYLYGWRFEDWHVSPEQGGNYFTKITERLANDPRVIGWTPFGAGPTQDWIDKGFQYDNEPVITEKLQKYWLVSDPPGPIPVPVEYQPQIMLGVDLSSNNDNEQNPNDDVDLQVVYNVGRNFALLKTSEIYRSQDGQLVRYVNPFFKKWWQDCAQDNMVRGGYIYGRPATASPVDTVELYDEALQSVGGLQRGDINMLDSEEDGPNVFRWTIETLDVLYQKYGFKPWWYTSMGFINAHGLNHPEIASRCHLMLAAWGTEKPQPPTAFSRVAAWQFTSTGTVPGVTGPCDEDVFFGTLDELIATGKP